MKFASQDAAKVRRVRKSEAVILFSIAGRMFVIAADAVQEIRSTDSLAGAAVEMEQPGLPKVRHTLDRGNKTYYVVNAGAHFGLPVTRPTLVLILRQFRAAFLVDRIERLAEIVTVHPLPRAFTGEEKRWYRGLAHLDDRVIPVIQPSGFLTPEEFHQLDRSTRLAAAQRETEGAVQA
jgi:chemotaxis signal transduction protein